MEEKNKYGKTGFPGFLRYIGNNLTGREKNSFERELQKDPFAEEAEDGLSSIGEDALRNDMRHLASRLERRTSRSRRIIAYRIAASVAVLMTISTIYLLLQRSGDIKPSAGPVTMEISKTEPIKAEKEELQTERRSDLIMQPEDTKRKVDQVVPEKQIALNTERKAKSDTTVNEEKISPPELITADNISNVSMAVPVSRSIGIPGTSRDSVLKDSLTPATVALSEVVVTGYGARSKSRDVGAAAGADKSMEKKDAVNLTYTAPEPIIGKKGFEDYIEASIKKPDILKAGDKEVVVLSFIVRINGIPDSIVVVRSPGDPYSKEAIRLIKEGPKWKPATENGNPIEEEARVRIVFTSQAHQ